MRGAIGLCVARVGGAVAGIEVTEDRVVEDVAAPLRGRRDAAAVPRREVGAGAVLDVVEVDRVLTGAEVAVDDAGAAAGARRLAAGVGAVADRIDGVMEG